MCQAPDRSSKEKIRRWQARQAPVYCCSVDSLRVPTPIGCHLDHIGGSLPSRLAFFKVLSRRLHQASGRASYGICSSLQVLGIPAAHMWTSSSTDSLRSHKMCSPL